MSEYEDLPNGRFKTLNGERIEFLMTEVAIGGPPSTIWVGAEKKWFEIRPSAAYRATYQNMLHVVCVHFANLDYHETNKSWYEMDIHGTPWGVCKVLAEVRTAMRVMHNLLTVNSALSPRPAQPFSSAICSK